VFHTKEGRNISHLPLVYIYDSHMGLPPVTKLAAHINVDHLLLHIIIFAYILAGQWYCRYSAPNKESTFCFLEQTCV